MLAVHVGKKFALVYENGRLEQVNILTCEFRH